MKETDIKREKSWDPATLGFTEINCLSAKYLRVRVGVGKVDILRLVY